MAAWAHGQPAQSSAIGCAAVQHSASRSANGCRSHSRALNSATSRAKSLVIVYRYAEGKYERLPELAADLPRRTRFVARWAAMWLPMPQKRPRNTHRFRQRCRPSPAWACREPSSAPRKSTGVTLLRRYRLETLGAAQGGCTRSAACSFLWNPDHPDNGDQKRAEKRLQALEIELQIEEISASTERD